MTLRCHHVYSNNGPRYRLVVRTFDGDGEVRGLVNGLQLRQLTQPTGVPDTGSTLALLGGAFAAVALLRRKLIASAD